MEHENVFPNHFKEKLQQPDKDVVCDTQKKGIHDTTASMTHYPSFSPHYKLHLAF